MSGMTGCYCVRTVIGEYSLPKEVSVGVNLLMISVELTDLVRDVLSGYDGHDKGFDGRLRDIEVEYGEVQQDILRLDSVLSRVYTIGCAELVRQLREIESIVLSESSEKERNSEKCERKKLSGKVIERTDGCGGPLYSRGGLSCQGRKREVNERGRYGCEVCGRDYARPASLRAHQRREHEE